MSLSRALTFHAVFMRLRRLVQHPTLGSAERDPCSRPSKEPDSHGLQGPIKETRMAQPTNGHHADAVTSTTLLAPGESTGDPIRQLSDADWTRYEGYAAEILTSFGLDLSMPGTADTPRRFLRAHLRCDRGLRGRPEASDRLSDRVPRRRKLRARPGRRGADPLRRRLRAPRAAVHRPGVDRLCRPRPDHRRQQAHPPRSRPHPPFRRPGAHDARHRRLARGDGQRPRDGGAARGTPPVHPDARCPRARAADPNDRATAAPMWPSPRCETSSSP